MGAATTTWRRRIALAALALAACESKGAAPAPAPPPPPGPDEPFIAFASTFADFRSWPSFHSDGPPVGSYPEDVLGPRTQYLNRRPPPGRTTFPVGTVIVEARESGERKIFAAVKRGAGYNPRGAIDWEWFELNEAVDGGVSLAWRGLGPPAGQTYGHGGASTCNECHANCPVNDSICSPKLKLAGF
jgi:hypothetical protein